MVVDLFPRRDVVDMLTNLLQKDVEGTFLCKHKGKNPNSQKPNPGYETQKKLWISMWLVDVSTSQGHKFCI